MSVLNDNLRMCVNIIYWDDTRYWLQMFSTLAMDLHILNIKDMLLFPYILLYFKYLTMLKNGHIFKQKDFSVLVCVFLFYCHSCIVHRQMGTVPLSFCHGIVKRIMMYRKYVHVAFWGHDMICKDN